MKSIGTNEDHSLKHPPVGLIPRKCWLESRIAEINRAIVRYAAEDKAIPVEWLTEYFQISNEVKELQIKEVGVDQLRNRIGLPPLSSMEDRIKG